MKITGKTKQKQKVEQTEAISKPMTKDEFKKIEAEIKKSGKYIREVGIVLNCFIKQKRDLQKTQEFLEIKYGKEKAKFLMEQFNTAF
jgi:hypothetical protein